GTLARGFALPSSRRIRGAVATAAPTCAVCRFPASAIIEPGATTLTAALPFTAPDVAVIVALPSDTAVTTPEPLTVATEGLFVPHVTGQVVGLPSTSRGAAVSATVPPGASCGAPGVTSMKPLGYCTCVRTET